MEEVRSGQGAADEPAAPDRSAPDGETEEPSSPESLKAQLQEAIERANRLEASWQRSQADLANYRKQTEREREEQAALASAVLVKDLLSILDDLDRALGSVAEQLRSYTWVDGVWLIQRKLEAILKAHGLEEVPALGQSLDPLLHQAVGEAEGAPGKVVSVVQKGYTVGGRLLRSSLVVVGQETSEPPSEPQPAQDEASPAEGGGSEAEPS